MSIKNKTINLYTEWKPLIDGLSNEEAGKLLKDIFNYQSDNEVCNTNPVWLFIKSKIDEYNLNGTAISKVRSEAGKKGMEKRWGITNDNKCYQMITNDNKNNNKIKENKIKENINNIINGVVLKKNQFLISDKFRISDIPEIDIYEKEVGKDLLMKVQSWLIDKKCNQIVDYEFICKQIVNFSRRQGLI